METFLKKARRGSTLVEVVISVLVIGLVCAAVTPVFITASLSVGQADRRQAATAAVRRLSEELKGYVTADRDPDTGPRGPGTGSGGWYLPGDLSGKWALEEGRHDLDADAWCPDLKDGGGSMYYTVSVTDTPSGPRPDVHISVEWTDSGEGQ